MLILFYSSSHDPFRSPVDYSIQLPLDAFTSSNSENSVPPAAENYSIIPPPNFSLQRFRHWINLETAYAFQFDFTASENLSFLENPGERIRKYFVDDEGDNILLDNDESYREALKVSQKSSGLLRIVVEAELKKDIAASQQQKIQEKEMEYKLLDAAVPSQLGGVGPIPEMRRPHSETFEMARENLEEPLVDIGEPLPPKNPPPWLKDCLNQQMKLMKDELREELIQSFSSMSTSFQSTPHPVPENQGSMGSTPDDLLDFFSKYVEEDKPIAPVENGGKRAEVGEKKQETKPKKIPLQADHLPSDCDLCCRKLEGVRFVCLKLNRCGVVLCSECMGSAGHPMDHVMLRVPIEFRGKPRRLVENAEMILCGVKKPNKKAKKKGTTDPLAKFLDNWEKKKPAEPISGPNPDMLSQLKLEPYGILVLTESETRLMSTLTEQTGAYWKRWTVENSGRIAWDSNIELSVVFLSSPEIQAFAPGACVPHLQPGQKGDLVVWVYGPLNGNGICRACWQMYDKQAGKTFGQLLTCEWTLKPAEEDDGNTKDSELWEMEDDGEGESEDDFSLVATGEEPEFEMVTPPLSAPEKDTPDDSESTVSTGIMAVAHPEDTDHKLTSYYDGFPLGAKHVRKVSPGHVGLAERIEQNVKQAAHVIPDTGGASKDVLAKEKKEFSTKCIVESVPSSLSVQWDSDADGEESEKLITLEAKHPTLEKVKLAYNSIASSLRKNPEKASDPAIQNELQELAEFMFGVDKLIDNQSESKKSMGRNEEILDMAMTQNLREEDRGHRQQMPREETGNLLQKVSETLEREKMYMDVRETLMESLQVLCNKKEEGVMEEAGKITVETRMEKGTETVEEEAASVLEENVKTDEEEENFHEASSEMMEESSTEVKVPLSFEFHEEVLGEGTEGTEGNQGEDVAGRTDNAETVTAATASLEQKAEAQNSSGINVSWNTSSSGEELNPLNPLLDGALRLATTALDTAKRAIQHAGKQINNAQQHNSPRQWFPPSQWTPVTLNSTSTTATTTTTMTTSFSTNGPIAMASASTTGTMAATGWVPRATQTPGDWPEPISGKLWMPPQLWTPQAHAQAPTQPENLVTSEEAGQRSEVEIEEVAEGGGEEAQYAEEVGLLVSMGFADVEKLQKLLKENGGDVNKVVDILLMEFEFVTASE